METRKKQSKRSKKGFGLPLVVLMILLLALIGNGLLTLGYNSRMQAIRSTADIGARAATDAAIMQAMHLMNMKADDELTWNNDSLPVATDVALPNSNLTFSFDVAGDPMNGFIITSTGRSGFAQRKVYVTTRLKSVFEFAILVQDNIALSPGVTVEGWTSDPTITDTSLLIGTNSTLADSIIMENAAIVDGDVAVGVGGDVDTVIAATEATITGQKFALPQEQEFPPIAAPIDLGFKGAIDDSIPQLVPADSGTYTSFTLGNSGSIDVNEGDVVLHIIGDVIIRNGAEINIKNVASLTVYLVGDWVSHNSSSINTESQTPADFTLYGLGDEDQMIDLKAKGEFYGVVYAPDADVIIRAKTDIYGAVICKNFDMKNNNTVFHYDAALKQTHIDDLGVRFAINTWREE